MSVHAAAHAGFAGRWRSWGYALLRRLGQALSLFIGVTALSYVLIVHYGPDLTYTLLGKNPSAEEVATVRHTLGYDRSLVVRYGEFLANLARGELGHSDESGERISVILRRSLPVSLALLLPGFVLGHVLGLLLAMAAAWQRQRLADQLLSLAAVIGMSLSFPVVILLAQWGLSSRAGLDAFPVQGWEVQSATDYLKYTSVPSLALLVVTLGYNLRFYRALLVDELAKDYVLTARAYGAGASTILFRHVLVNLLIPILTRVLYSLPSLLVGGSLLLEKHFGIPGVGLVSYAAVVNGDQSLLLVIVALTAALFVSLNQSIDSIYTWLDPRLAQRHHQ